MKDKSWKLLLLKCMKSAQNAIFDIDLLPEKTWNKYLSGKLNVNTIKLFAAYIINFCCDTC